MKAGPARAVHDQIGARNTWMRCEAFDAPAQRLAAPAQLDREHEAGELRLCIDLHRPVTALCLQIRSEEHTSELQSLMRISSAVFFLIKKRLIHIHITTIYKHITTLPT